MQFQILAFAALAAALPQGNTDGDQPLTPPVAGSVDVCTGGYTAQCCATNVLGLASLECSQVPDVITSRDNFQAQCADQGLSDNCCLIPILGQGLICQSPQGN
ncbi:hypothetical protein CKM354_000575500 [Cercospora kikuchii]|uniref:Cryparin n=1 Tax=Cercospora kikuchii TaxID=84275 RepID=A0A9P3CL62_9PEZI|nr:uncharacterized protein CKM354_000575500 [Cercospora kikuchii]GIZ42485.1 hypothetical protein CKM354_000575500 [Cercospora kikuchii]